ncbi:MAG TPA: T9SS type A sorting domain-containing protein, partial [Bacteroidales bacterium]|nr:T9SS type A sorting domain-containing protein [Bacteroidales bacterium]
ATQGSYPVTLTVTKGTESHTTTLENFITAWAEPTAPIAHDTSACYAMPVPDLIAEGENIRWYSDSLLTNQVYSGNTFPTGITQIGTFNYYVTQSAGTCEGPATMVTLTISDYPIVTLTPFETVCVNTDPFELTGGNPEGGLWQGIGVDTNYFNPSTAGAGEHPLSYTYTNEFGCSTTISQPITVMDLPEVSLAPFTPLCDNTDPIELTGGVPEGGIYSGNGVENGFFYPSNIGAGETEILYSYTDNTTGCSNFASQSISVKASPIVLFGGDTTICHNHVITLDATNENSTYLWSTGETTPAIIVDSTGVGIGGVKNISVTVNNSDGCIASANINITFKDCTGIEELASSLGISIYPNPNQGNFTIEFHAKQPTSVNMRILNLFAQQVFALDNLKINTQTLQKINLDQLPDGIYILVIETNGRTFTQKFVINK